jgi:hypothetical protein
MSGELPHELSEIDVRDILKDHFTSAADFMLDRGDEEPTDAQNTMGESFVALADAVDSVPASLMKELRDNAVARPAAFFEALEEIIQAVPAREPPMNATELVAKLNNELGRRKD